MGEHPKTYRDVTVSALLDVTHIDRDRVSRYVRDSIAADLRVASPLSEQIRAAARAAADGDDADADLTKVSTTVATRPDPVTAEEPVRPVGDCPCTGTPPCWVCHDTQPQPLPPTPPPVSH